MIIAAAVLTAAISVDIDLTSLARRVRRPKPPVATCNIKTVGYRFIGRPGQEFRYAGDTYVIPREGSMELIADKRNTTYTINKQEINADGEEHDQFGFRDVFLPAN